MKVRDIALKEVHCANPSTNLAHIAAMMKRHNVGAIPVCEGKRLVGIITDRDLVITCIASDLEANKCPAREFMTSHPVTVTPDTNLEDAAKLMGKEQVHRLPVMEGDDLVGILSLGDIAMALKDDALVAETLRRISLPTHAPAATR